MPIYSEMPFGTCIGEGPRRSSDFYLPEPGVVQFVKHFLYGDLLEIGGFYGDAAIPMLDIDVKNEDIQRPFNVLTTGEGISQIEKLTVDLGSLQRVYLTPGGIRSFEMSMTMCPGAWWGKHTLGDPGYRDWSMLPIYIRSDFVETAFVFRTSMKSKEVSPKLYVCAYLGLVGDPQIMLSESKRKVERYHDYRIGIGTQWHTDKAMNDVLAVLNEVPRYLQDQIKSFYNL